MQFKGGLILKFLIPMLTIFLATGLVLSIETRRIIQNEMIERAQIYIADFVQSYIKHYVYEESDFSLDDPSKTEQVFGDLKKELKTRDMLRIKVWDKQGTVVFSDAKDIIGKNFSGNKNFQQAISGKVAVEIKKPIDPDNIAEVGYEQLMEVYVPVFFENKLEPSGVVEVYYKMDLLNKNIRQTQIVLLRAIVITFVVVAVQFIILFWFVILRPIKRLEMGIREVKKLGGEVAGD